MRLFLKFLLGAVVALATLCGGVRALRTPILEGRVAPGLGWILLALAPPPDLPHQGGSVVIDPSATGNHYRFTATHRYVGGYVIGLAVDRGFRRIGTTEDLGLRLRLVCDGVGGSVFDRELGADPSPWWSGGPERHGGFTLSYYEVPKDIPRGERLECSATVVHGSVEFAKRYGATRLYLEKNVAL